MKQISLVIIIHQAIAKIHDYNIVCAIFSKLPSLSTSFLTLWSNGVFYEFLQNLWYRHSFHHGHGRRWHDWSVHPTIGRKEREKKKNLKIVFCGQLCPKNANVHLMNKNCAERLGSSLASQNDWPVKKVLNRTRTNSVPEDFRRLSSKFCLWQNVFFFLVFVQKWPKCTNFL
jgi:hypothetical protein